MIKRTNSFDMDQKEEQVNDPNHRVTATIDPKHNQDKNVKESKIIRKHNTDSNDSIFQSRENADRVHDLDQGPIDHRSIKMSHQPPAPSALTNSENRLTSTTVGRMRGSKIPAPILQSIIQLASGKKPADRMTNSRISKALLQKMREVKGNYFICDICAMEYKEQDKKKIGKCPHSFCDSCLRHYVDYKISRFEQVLCPSENCPEVIDTEGEFYKSLTDQHKEKYRKVHAFSEVAKNPSSRLCPNEKCKDGVLQIQEGVNPKCKNCGKVYCGKCLFPQHSGPCETNQIDFFQNNLHFRQCTNCKSVVQKTVGCNHIKCRCNYQFCYLCGEKWLNYQHKCGTNPQAQPAQPAQPVENVPQNNCCECLQGDDCCVSFLRILFKIFVMVPFFLLMMTVFIFFDLILLVCVFFLAILMGVFPYTFQFICDQNCPWNLIFLILYPISMIVGIVRSFSDFFCEAAGNILDMFGNQVQGLIECGFRW